MSPTVSIFGLGYVGTVTAACLALKGNRVTGVDLGVAKVETMDSGRSPIVEPAVADLIAECQKASRLRATTDSRKAVLETEITFLCVGTPSMRNGKLDLGHIGPVCDEIGQALRKKDSFHLIVLRSTVLPGTAETIVVPTLEKASRKRLGKDFGVCVNRSSCAKAPRLRIFLNPRSPSLALQTQPTAESCANFIPGFRARCLRHRSDRPRWSSMSATRGTELKLHLPTKWNHGQSLGVDAEAVIEIFSADTKLNISPSYLKPGFAFGGSCLPKRCAGLELSGQRA